MSQSNSVSVPLELDYPLLQQLLIRQLFTDQGQSREILDDPSGCSQVVLSKPQVSPQGSTLEIVAQLEAQLGVSVLGECNPMLHWQGGVGFLGLPVIQPGATAVRLEPQQSWLVSADGSKITSGQLWEVARDHLQTALGSFTFDLAVYTENLDAMLPEVLPRHSVEQLQTIIDSVKLGGIQVAPASLNVSLDFEIAVLPELTAEPVLSTAELEQWEQRWQMMDALLVLAVKHYAAATSLEELRITLLDILIDSRYQLRDALAAPVDPENDAVRSWFLQSWDRLGPVVRRIGLEQEGQEPLLWFGVIAATDALSALDQLGPAAGLDISADGLRRLARLISQNDEFEALRYSEEIDPELQQLFQQRFESGAAKPSAWNFDFSLVPLAYAASAGTRLNSWVPRKEELGEYLPMVAQLLDESSVKVMAKHQLPREHEKLFKRMVLATAWQESCWRQYIVKSDRIETLRSGTGDVGLMQINERVWRGFYDIHSLRWDIGYNSNAGAEVLLNYLVRYALKQGEQKQPGGRDNLARASYSAYNGGPSAVSRYRRSGVPASLVKVDAAFWDKYRQVSAGNAMAVSRCLGGDVPAGKKPAAQDPGERWLRAQNAKHFTLQLGAFSQREFAAQFVQQESLSPPVHVLALRSGGNTRFVVLHGSFSGRAEADSAKRHYQHLKPWVRSFGDLRQ